MAYNPYIVVPLATWAVAQVAKFAIAALNGRIDFRYLYASGSMPSVHAAVVCSLATTAFLIDGLQSHLFGLTAILAAIVMYDSLGVRRSAGEQAVAINMLIASLERSKFKLEQPNLHIREILGHQPSEVAAGAALGVVLGGLFNYDRLTPLWHLLQRVPTGIEFWGYLVFFAVTIVAGLVQLWVWRSRRPKSRTIKKLTHRIWVATQVVGWLGLALSVLQYERAGYLSWRLWTWLVLAGGLIWAAVLVAKSFRTVPEALAEEAEEARKRRWFQWGRRKSKR